MHSLSTGALKFPSPPSLLPPCPLSFFPPFHFFLLPPTAPRLTASRHNHRPSLFHQIRSGTLPLLGSHQQALFHSRRAARPPTLPSIRLVSFFTSSSLSSIVVCRLHSFGALPRFSCTNRHRHLHFEDGSAHALPRTARRVYHCAGELHSLSPP